MGKAHTKGPNTREAVGIEKTAHSRPHTLALDAMRKVGAAEEERIRKNSGAMREPLFAAVLENCCATQDTEMGAFR